MISKEEIDKTDFHGFLSRKSTITPRLEYALRLTDNTLKELRKERHRLSKNNQNVFADCSDLKQSELGPINQEKILHFVIDSLNLIKRNLQNLSGIESLPKSLPPLIPTIRTLSAQLFSHFPTHSQNLIDLSLVLGGILMDSATLTGARFDFHQTNKESTTLLDEVKLMVDSKINKQYPNLSILKAENTWTF